MRFDARIQAWMDEAEALVVEQAEMGWRNWVFGEPLDLARTYEGHEHLFSVDTIMTVRQAAQAAAAGRSRRALEYFANYLTGEYISMAVAAVEDRLQNLQAEATVEVHGQSVPYRQLPVLLANEADYERRGQLSDAAVPVLRRLNPMLRDKESMSQELAGALGFSDYIALAEELRRVDLHQLASLCEHFLEASEPLYLETLPQMTERLVGLELDRFRRADVSRMLKLVAFDAFFPRDELLPMVNRVLSGLGISLGHQRNVLIHDQELPKKNPRAVCFPVRVPHEIRVSVKPVGGASDYEALLHEMGHAEHYAHTSVPYFPLQQLGNATATESYAFLFEGLVENDAWLSQFTAMSADRRAEFRRFRAFIKLFFVRRYCAKLLYELRLHSNEPNPKAAYREHLQRAYGFRLSDNDAEHYLNDVDDGFYAADYLRAWFVEAQLSSYFAERFGPEWFQDPEAGNDLKELWSHGNELEGRELLERIGAHDYDPAFLLTYLDKELNPSVQSP